MKYKSFARKWSSRFLRYRGKAKDATLWCTQLCSESQSCNWVRLIVPKWDHMSFSDLHSTQGVVSWLEGACMHPAFVKQRKWNDLSTGVQVWLSHQEDVAAFFVCVPDAVQNQRYFTCGDAQQDWLAHWQPKVDPHVIPRSN